MNDYPEKIDVLPVSNPKRATFLQSKYSIRTDGLYSQKIILHTFFSGCYGLGVIEPALYKSTLDLDEMTWPDGHIGRIWFSLRYEPSTEKLLVSLLKAKNLPSRSVGTVNNCDPFVR